MKKKFKFGVIGAGFMSTAIVQGVIKSKVVNKEDVLVSDVNDVALDKMRNNGVFITKDNRYLCNNCDFVLFAVKPQSFASVLQDIKDVNCNNFLSIMAGVKKSTIKRGFTNDIRVARAMPNTPCSIKCGAIGIDLTDYDSFIDDKKFIKDLFSSIGKIVEVPEELLGVVTGVSGSSPAYFYLFLKGIVEAGVKNGLKYDDALNLVTNTMIGAGNMVLSNTDKTLDELISAVCSKGGTTIQAVNVYNENFLSEITDKAVDACIKRSIELENI